MLFWQQCCSLPGAVPNAACLSVHLQRHLQSCSPNSHTVPCPQFYPIFQDKRGGEKERKKPQTSLNLLLLPETLQFTRAVNCSWVSSWQQLGVNSSPSYPLQKWALADWTNISYLPASPPLLDNSRVNPLHHLLSPAPWYWHLRNTELFIFHWRAHTINFHISESSYCSLLSGSIEWWQ